MLLNFSLYLLNKLIIVQKPEKKKEIEYHFSLHLFIHSTAMIVVYKSEPRNK